MRQDNRQKPFRTAGFRTCGDLKWPRAHSADSGRGPASAAGHPTSADRLFGSRRSGIPEQLIATRWRWLRLHAGGQIFA